MDKLISDLKYMNKVLEDLKELDINSLDLEKTILFIVDINNGFAKKGFLYSSRIEKLIEPIKELGNYISKSNGKIIAFTDCHTKDSVELKTYPNHCLKNEEESDVVDEIKSIKNIKIIHKNSTNGFFCIDNMKFDNIENIIVVGGCSDICVYQFTITLKGYFNQNNIYKKMIVPTNLVDTYDIPQIHNAEIMNMVFLNSMLQNGINVVKSITLKKGD